MFELHERYTFNKFRGLFDRGRDESCPLDYLLECENAQFEKDGIITRMNFNQQGGTLGGTTVVEVLPITSGTSTLYLVSTTTPGLGSTDLYYFNGSVISAPILSLSSAVWNGKFSAVQIKNRIYFVPLDGTSNVYVFDISWSVARQAGCATPGSAVTAAAAAGGIIERGDHLIGVIYETDTGFYSTIGGLALATVDGTQLLNLTTIPTGTSEVTKRHIVATKALYNYDGNPSAQEFFFVPNGTINDNVTTVLAGVNFYDSQLVDSADKYVNQLTRIPQCRRLTLYNGRLVAVAPLADTNTCYVSAVNEPESIDSVDGILSSAPATYRGIEDVAELRGNLYIFRDTSTQVTTDNNDNPSTWNVETVDKSQGIRTNSVSVEPSTAIGATGQQPIAINDGLLVLTKDGLKFFNGAYGEDLSYAIRDKILALSGGTVAVSAIGKFVIVGTPLLAYYGDFSEGLTAAAMKWSKWVCPAFGSNYAAGLYRFVVNAASGQLYYALENRVMGSGGGTEAIDACSGASSNIQVVMRLPFIHPSPGKIYQFNEIVARATTGTNTANTAFIPSMFGLDDIKTLNPTGFESPTTGKPLVKWFNFVSDACSLRFASSPALPTYLIVRSISLAYKFLWNARKH